MKILVIDGMGGGIGKAVIEHIRSENKDLEIIAVGTNSAATSVMLKAGADQGATGENAVKYNSKKADVIIGAMGIVIVNSMYGEISPKMAKAVSSSRVHKILIPKCKCGVSVLGLEDKPIQAYIAEINETLKTLLNERYD